MRKKTFAPALLVLTLASLFTLSGCGNAASSSTAAGDAGDAPPSSPPAVTQHETEDTLKDQTPVASGSIHVDTGTSSGEAIPGNADPGAEQMLTGVIDGAGMGHMQVLLEDGMVLDITYDDADISELEDTLPGSAIAIYYTGQLVGNDTSAITVTRLATP